MNQIFNFSDQLSQLDSQTYVIMVAIGLVICIVYCFYGYSCVRFMSALIGFCIGISIGIWISNTFGLNSPLDMIIPCVLGLALALISYGIYRLSVFLTVFSAVLGVANSLVTTYAADRMNEIARLITVLAVALVAAILAEVFMRPLIIVTTAVTGGIAFSSLLFSEVVQVTWSSQIAFYTKLAVAAVLAILGMIRQFKR